MTSKSHETNYLVNSSFCLSNEFFSNLTGLPKESIPGYIGNQFALFLTKLNQANQGLLVRQYFERLNLLNDFRGEAARQFLLAVSRSPLPFFLSYVIFHPTVYLFSPVLITFLVSDLQCHQLRIKDLYMYNLDNLLRDSLSKFSNYFSLFCY